MFRTIDRYEETALGLPYPVILIDSAEEEIDERTGGRIGVSIPDLEALVASVAVARAVIPLRLDGEEVRFMRHALGMSATALADALTLDKATLSRWEHNKHQVGEWADKQVRLFVVVKLAPAVPHLSVDARSIVTMRVRQSPGPDWPRLELRRVAAPAGAGAGREEWDMARAA